MNDALKQLAAQLDLADPSREQLRLRFAHACVCRVLHLLKSPEVLECFQELEALLATPVNPVDQKALSAQAMRLAHQKQDSIAIDGRGHAEASAIYALAKAIEGRALGAATYAAYAAVYAKGGYAAAAERESFAEEFDWQARTLALMVVGEVHARVAASVAGGSRMH